MSEELLVKHCSPTLAGIKTGNMFTCSFSCDKEMKNHIRYWNSQLKRKGLCILPLKFSNNRALIYLYRPSKLKKDLLDITAKQILCEHGYPTYTCGQCIAHLIRRLRECGDFPHEVGLFLGYPPEDVLGFIENKAEGCKYIGVWKVYGDVEKARETFDKFKKCTASYCSNYAKGKTIEQLAIAG